MAQTPDDNSQEAASPETTDAGASVIPAHAAGASPLVERLAGRAATPLGLIDVRAAQQRFERTSGWVAHRFGLLGEVLDRRGAASAGAADAGGAHGLPAVGTGRPAPRQSPEQGAWPAADSAGAFDAERFARFAATSGQAAPTPLSQEAPAQTFRVSRKPAPRAHEAPPAVLPDSHTASRPTADAARSGDAAGVAQPGGPESPREASPSQTAPLQTVRRSTQAGATRGDAVEGKPAPSGNVGEGRARVSELSSAARHAGGVADRPAGAGAEASRPGAQVVRDAGASPVPTVKALQRSPAGGGRVAAAAQPRPSSLPLARGLMRKAAPAAYEAPARQMFTPAMTPPPPSSSYAAPLPLHTASSSSRTAPSSSYAALPLSHAARRDAAQTNRGESASPSGGAPSASASSGVSSPSSLSQGASGAGASLARSVGRPAAATSAAGAGGGAARTPLVLARAVAGQGAATSGAGAATPPPQAIRPGAPVAAEGAAAQAGATCRDGHDVEQLAEQVSRIIYRRLAVERERRGAGRCP